MSDLLQRILAYQTEIDLLRRERNILQVQVQLYRKPPEEVQRETLEYLVHAAFEHGAISHGRAAELLGCTVVDIRELGWVQGDCEEDIASLTRERDEALRALLKAQLIEKALLSASEQDAEMIAQLEDTRDEALSLARWLEQNAEDYAAGRAELSSSHAELLRKGADGQTTDS